MRICFHCMNRIDQEAGICPYCRKSTIFDAPDHHLLPGTLLSGKYLVGLSLGEGGFGITYIAMDLEQERRIAIKEYYPNGCVNRFNKASAHVTCSRSEGRGDVFEAGKRRFMSEARILSSFSDQPGIVSVYDSFEENNTAYIVMEYLEGMDLKEYVKKNGVLRFDECINMLLPLIYTLSSIHEKGLIHRDISPDNIRLVLGGVKLLDFGAAKDVSSGANQSLSVTLKPGYAPEEQYRSHGVQGPWTDIYALCATIYKCITGKTPDESIERMSKDELKLPSQLGIAISEKSEAALMKGLSVRADDRYRTIPDLLSDLLGTQTSPASASAPPKAQAKGEFTVTISSVQKEKEYAQSFTPYVPPVDNNVSQSTFKQEPAAKIADRENGKNKRTLIVLLDILALIVFLIVSYQLMDYKKQKWCNECYEFHWVTYTDEAGHHWNCGFISIILMLQIVVISTMKIKLGFILHSLVSAGAVAWHFWAIEEFWGSRLTEENAIALISLVIYAIIVILSLVLAFTKNKRLNQTNYRQ